MQAVHAMVLFSILGSSSRRSVVQAFRSGNIQTQISKSTSTQLHQANFLETLQRSFSQTAMSGGSNAGKTVYTVGITGASGLVGTALRDQLSDTTIDGKPVRILSLNRSTTTQPLSEDELVTSVNWNPSATDPSDILHPSVVNEMDAIVHLSGENVSTGLGPLGFLGVRPWTDAKKAEIMDSRVTLTSALSKVVAAAPGRITFLCASGVGGYGDDFIGDAKEAVDESADISETKGFLADVSRAWEAATMDASKKTGSRVVNMRFGVVLSTKGGALGKLYPIFFLGGGGNVGSGQQYFSFISARDLARAILHTLETPSLQGPVNFCAPTPCTNAEFTKALGSAINRPTILPLPAFVVSLLFGQMGEEMLLGGVRCLPSKLVETGFEFQHPTIDAAVTSALKEKI